MILSKTGSHHKILTEFSANLDETQQDIEEDLNRRYSGKRMEIGEGKFESVPKFQIPGKIQEFESQELYLEPNVETVSEAFSSSQRREEIDADEASNTKVDAKPILKINTELAETKETRREEQSKCLFDSIDVAASDSKNKNKANEKVSIKEDDNEQVVSTLAQDGNGLIKLSPDESNHNPTEEL